MLLTLQRYSRSRYIINIVDFVFSYKPYVNRGLGLGLVVIDLFYAEHRHLLAVSKQKLIINMNE